MLGTIYRWRVAAFSSSLWTTSVAQIPDGRLVQMHVKIDALCEQQWRPNSIQGRNPGTCCTCCVSKDHWELSACSRILITCVSGQATTYANDTSKYGYSDAVKESTEEWNDPLLSSVMRVGSVCKRVLYTHVHKWLPEINKTMFTPTSTFIPVRSAESSLRDCVVLELQTVEDILGKPV